MGFTGVFSILPPIISLYTLAIATLYRHLYIKYIEIAYNISYKGSLYFAIPDVSQPVWLWLWSCCFNFDRIKFQNRIANLKK